MQARSLAPPLLLLACAAASVHAYRCSHSGPPPVVASYSSTARTAAAAGLPRAPRGSTVDVWWLEAPLLQKEALGLLQMKHIGVGFTVRESPAINWTVEYYAYWGFLNTLVPHAEREGGRCELTECNRGAVDAVPGLDPSRWSPEAQRTADMTRVGQIPARAFNRWAATWLARAVARPHVYDLLQDGSRWLPMYTCQTFAQEALASLAELGAEFSCGSHALVSDQVLVSASKPAPVLPSDDPGVCEYYALFPSFADMSLASGIESFVRIALHGQKYIFTDGEYYRVDPAFPYLEFLPRPLVPPGC
eukprot:m51a1_g11107 putative ceroid-lipofuscinosis neuronal protein 5 (305) ;mRNA; f:67708-69090